MELATLLFIVATAALAGAVFGYVLRWLITLGKKQSVELMVKQSMLEAQEKAQQTAKEAERQAQKIIGEAKEKETTHEIEWKKKEDHLLQKDELLDKRQADLDKESDTLKIKAEEASKLQEELKQLAEKRQAELQKIAEISPEEAKREIIALAEKTYEEDIVSGLRKLENAGKEKLEAKAKEILVTTIQRLASNTVSEVTSTMIEIPSDDIKGKIIGKEGRNIRAFEKATGVEVIIDDTPGTVTLSSFDPVRREIARIALNNLILDGRIQPAKIEEAAAKAKDSVMETIKQKGEQAVFEAGVFNLDPRVLLILGRLYFRTSYGQNVLQHSIEVAHLAGMLAEELGADAAVARTGALLHDIGKAVDHEVSGTHVEIGRRILEKFGVDEAVIKAMQAHHGEYPYETLESTIVQTADAISGGRPGARRDSLENYLRRLKELEALANSFSGIEKSYAIQAGREIRVFVRPGEISDLDAKKLARDIAVKIEQELKYPGEIKIVIIRETRVIEYAR